MNNFYELIKNRVAFFDGAMGTILQQRGLVAGEIPELWNLSHESEIFDIHRSYVLAGADIIKTNTFGANILKFSGDEDTLQRVIEAGVRIAKNANPDGLVALDVGPLGKLLKPFGDLSFSDAYDAFAKTVKIGAQAGADVILIETMSDVYEAKAAVLAAKENSKLPVLLTMAFDEKGRLLTGADITAATLIFEGLGVDAFGFNCGLGPGQMLELMPELMSVCSMPVIVNPNAGLPVSVDGKTVFNVDADDFAKAQEQIYLQGAALLGGCCGTTPEHIKAMTELLKDKKPVSVKPQEITAVTSYCKTAVFGARPLIVGERINPTGKKRLKEALRANDTEYILREAIAQTESGADILDVNVGLPEINEPEMMQTAVSAIQGICDLPLQIDTSDTEAMERALRIYNGKPLINSVNGKEESMSAVFPLAKKYGGAVVCLTLDEDGIPDTAEGRIKIAEKIIERAKEYGIKRKDLIIDALAMTISTGADNAKVTLETIDYVHNKMGLNTILGVSNISFGLPAREHINSVFFANAMERGLTSGIINPMSKAMMDAHAAFCALHGYDTDCAGYIARFSAEAEPPKKQEGAVMSLRDAVIRGLCEDAYNAAKTALLSMAPIDIINSELIPALDVVGDGFEKNKIFLPQLLVSADAAKRGFDAIKEFLIETGEKQESRGSIILATVKGDIHDIGKNIVKVLLENYGYTVIDLGKDVAPEIIVDTAVRENIRLVGLSALMTTTVCNMEETIKQLRKVSDCKVMVGGAVLTPEYAQSIGADFYSKDALGSVHYANRLFGYDD